MPIDECNCPHSHCRQCHDYDTASRWYDWNTYPKCSKCEEAMLEDISQWFLEYEDINVLPQNIRVSIYGDLSLLAQVHHANYLYVMHVKYTADRPKVLAVTRWPIRKGEL